MAQEATVFVRIRSTDCRQPSRKQEDRKDENTIHLGAKSAANIFIELTGKRNELVLRSNDYREAKENLEGKL